MNLVVLDVDGVISPCQYERAPHEQPYLSIDSGRNYFPLSLQEALNSLPADKAWLTTWGPDAEMTFRMGWHVIQPPWELSPAQESIYDWKPQALVQFLTINPAYTKMVWVDDEHSSWDVTPVQETGVELLLIEPPGFRGLSPAHLEQMRFFLG